MSSARNLSTRTPRSCPQSDALCVMRDIPLSDLNDRAQTNKRNCDGSLREEKNSVSKGGCASGRCGGWGLESNPLAMVYSPCQAWRDAYTPDVALERGTLFAELDLPFEGNRRKGGA
jgi:hypothetical protein